MRISLKIHEAQRGPRPYILIPQVIIAVISIHEVQADLDNISKSLP